MKKAEYPSPSCREPVWGVQAYTCELPDLHPGPHATFSQPNSVRLREAWERENHGWEAKIGKRDDIIPPPVRSLPNLPQTPVPEPQGAPQSRDEFVEWANSETRDQQIKSLTIGEILDEYSRECTRLNAKREQEGSGDVDEAMATMNHRLILATRLLRELRFGWGIKLSPDEPVVTS